MSREEMTPRKRKRKRKINKVRLTIFIVIVVAFAAYAQNIIRLEIENQALKKENQELAEQRDKLQIELKNVNSKEYIEDRARQQLRLVNPDEILFIFPDEETEESDSENNAGEN